MLCAWRGAVNDEEVVAVAVHGEGEDERGEDDAGAVLCCVQVEDDEEPCTGLGGPDNKP